MRDDLEIRWDIPLDGLGEAVRLRVSAKDKGSFTDSDGAKHTIFDAVQITNFDNAQMLEVEPEYLLELSEALRWVYQGILEAHKKAKQA
jgi:hypothetical protein